MRTLVAFFRIYSAMLMRFLVAIPASMVLSVVGALLSVALANASANPPDVLKTHPETFKWLAYVGVSIVLIQTWKGYLDSTYDIEENKKSGNIFFKELKNERYEAIQLVLKIYLEPDPKKKLELSRDTLIEPVLDVFEDLGLLLEGGKISDLVFHNCFYHWFMVYAEPLTLYIDALYMERQPYYRYLRRLYDRARCYEKITKGYFGIPNLRALEPSPLKYIFDEMKETEPKERRNELRPIIMEGFKLWGDARNSIYNRETKTATFNTFRAWLENNRHKFNAELGNALGEGIMAISLHQDNLGTSESENSGARIERADSLIRQELKRVDT